MTPLEHIKTGILTGNWNTVCEGFKMLTGENLSAPPNNNEQSCLIELRNRINNMLMPTSPELVVESPKFADNDFVDDMTEDTTPSKDSCYGQVVLITDTNVDQEEVVRNKERHEAASKRKNAIRRQRHKKREYVCSVCEQKFESEYELNVGIGQRCPQCLRQVRPD